MIAGIGVELSSHFLYVIDSDSNKWGSFLPGTGLPIVSPDAIEVDQIDCLLITSYTYFDEIYDQLEGFRLRGGVIIKMYPVPELVE